jgi:hypothetical protein
MSELEEALEQRSSCRYSLSRRERLAETHPGLAAGYDGFDDDAALTCDRPSHHE